MPARYLVIDVETIAIDDAGEYLEPVTAPSNYKDPAKIEAYIAEETQRRLEKAALDIDLARVVAIGLHESGITACELIGDAVDSEAQMLTRFWTQYRRLHAPTIVTFNGLAYDIPLLLRRSLYLGVDAPPLQCDRYRHPGIVDLADLLSYQGRQRMHSLSFYAKRFGLQVPSQEVTGADVAALWAAGKYEAVRQHCIDDVELTTALAKRMGLMRQTVELPESYEPVAAEGPF